MLTGQYSKAKAKLFTKAAGRGRGLRMCPLPPAKKERNQLPCPFAERAFKIGSGKVAVLLRGFWVLGVLSCLVFLVLQSTEWKICRAV